MSPKKLILLSASALVLAAASMQVLKQQEQATEAAVHPLLAPEFKAQINKIDRLNFTSTKQSSDVERDEGGIWRVKQRDGYRADTAKIRQLLYRLASSERMEKTTANPALLEKLSLSDLLAMRIRAYGAGEEKPLLDILTGDGDKTFKGTFVRMAGDNQSWRVSDDLTYGSDPMGWVEPIILDVNRDRLWQVRLEHKGLPSVEINRSTVGGEFSLKNMPQGAEKTGVAYDIQTIASQLENMKFTNVAKAEKLPDPVTTTAHFLTQDGLEVQVEIAPEHVSEQHWARISARFVPESIPNNEEVKKAAKKAEDVQKEAAEITARTSGWIYKLMPATYTSLSKKLDDFKPAPPAAAPAKVPAPAAKK